MKKVILSILVLSFSLVGFSQKINVSQSKSSFKIGNMFGSIKGTIDGMKGTVNFDETNLSSSIFNVCIDPASIDTKNEKRDEHLKNEDFFYVEKYLTICFVSKSITKKGDAYEAIGELTMHGVTKTVTIPFLVVKKGTTRTFTGELEINRFDYNLNYGNKFMVGEIASVTIVAVVE